MQFCRLLAGRNLSNPAEIPQRLGVLPSMMGGTEILARLRASSPLLCRVEGPKQAFLALRCELQDETVP